MTTFAASGIEIRRPMKGIQLFKARQDLMGQKRGFFGVFTLIHLLTMILKIGDALRRIHPKGASPYPANLAETRAVR